MKRRSELAVAFFLTWLFGSTFGVGGLQTADRPNILFIICDDLNDTVEGMGGHPQAHTPNIERLMRSGVRFTNAHCTNPVCGPSRASLWTGLYPHTTGIYGHNQNNYTWRDSPVLKDAVTLFEYFENHGYETFATGKIFHNNHHTVALFRERGQYDRFGINASFGPFPWDGEARHGFNVPHPSMNRPGESMASRCLSPCPMCPAFRRIDRRARRVSTVGWTMVVPSVTCLAGIEDQLTYGAVIVAVRDAADRSYPDAKYAVKHAGPHAPFIGTICLSGHWRGNK